MSEFNSKIFFEDFQKNLEETRRQSTGDDIALDNFGIDFFKIYLKLLQVPY